jgi:hypothetical protein
MCRSVVGHKNIHMGLLYARIFGTWLRESADFSTLGDHGGGHVPNNRGTTQGI